MFRVQFGERVFLFDDTVPLSMGDLEALYEMGVDPADWAALEQRAASWGDESTRSLSQSFDMVRTAAHTAFLAALRVDHSLKWRDFKWTINPEDLRDIGPVDEPDPAAPAPGAGVVDEPPEPTPAAAKRAKRTRKPADVAT